MTLEIGVSKIEKKFFEMEKQLDIVLSESRKTVRGCSNTIKALHSHDFKVAKTHLTEAEAGLEKIMPHYINFPDQINHALQEYTEAKIVFVAIEEKRIIKFDELNVPEVPYLNGLLDSVGELKREMYEALRKGDRKLAEEYFALMEAIYDELLPIRFSNAILPEFRRKQDVARIQIEQARGELL